MRRGPETRVRAEKYEYGIATEASTCATFQATSAVATVQLSAIANACDAEARPALNMESRSTARSSLDSLPGADTVPSREIASNSLVNPIPPDPVWTDPPNFEMYITPTLDLLDFGKSC
jgi:hypothetical protein